MPTAPLQICGVDALPGSVVVAARDAFVGLDARAGRVRDKDHLRFVAALPCLLCSATPSDAHHIRFAQPGAMARKVGDDFTVPLCRAHHRELHHSANEFAFWQ